MATGYREQVAADRNQLMSPGYHQTIKNKPVNVVVLSGGGTLDIISLHVLKFLEQESGKPISELFDLMVGSS